MVRAFKIFINKSYQGNTQNIKNKNNKIIYLLKYANIVNRVNYSKLNNPAYINSIDNFNDI